MACGDRDHRHYDDIDQTVYSSLTRAQRIELLNQRRANPPKRLAEHDYGHPSYCIACGQLADYSTEYIAFHLVGHAERYCPECKALRELDWLDQ